MKRTQICLTDRQHSLLTERAESIGISMAELLRRILDSYIDTEDNKDG